MKEITKFTNNSPLPWKEVLSKSKNKYQILDKNNKQVVNDVRQLGDSLYIEECCNNYPKAIELLKNAKDCISELRSLANGYENDFVEIDTFLKLLK